MYVAPEEIEKVAWLFPAPTPEVSNQQSLQDLLAAAAGAKQAQNIAEPSYGATAPCPRSHARAPQPRHPLPGSFLGRPGGRRGSLKESNKQ